MRCQIVNCLLAVSMIGLVQGFTPLSTAATTTAMTRRRTSSSSSLIMRAAEDEEDSKSSGGVVELGEEGSKEKEQREDDVPESVRGPLFISQGEVDPDTLNPDLSDAKQTRVILYTILSLLPVLFLIPFMLGRDFIPADQLPPVDMMQ